MPGLNLADVADDGDLPDIAPVQPRDPVSQQFRSPKPQPKQEAPQPVPAQPHVHQPFFATLGKQLGLSDEDLAATPPGVLERFVAHSQQPPAKAAPEPAKEPEPEPFDWGTDADGKALTEETAKAYYTAPVFKAIKAAERVEKLEKENAALKADFTKDRSERQFRQVQKQVHQLLAERPDLFGAKPGQAAKGSPEAKRYDMVWRELQALGADAKGPANDLPDILAIFGPAPAKPQKQTLLQKNGEARPDPISIYQNGELAVPTQRRNGQPLAYRDQVIERKRQELIEQGVPHNPAWDEDDDSDLPD